MLNPDGRLACRLYRALRAQPEQAGSEKAPGCRRRGDDHRDLVRELIGESLLDKQRVLRNERGIASELLAGGLTDHLHPESLSFGQFTAGLSLTGGFNTSGLGLRLSPLESGHPVCLS